MINNSLPNLPKRIILVRHGESEGNQDDSVFQIIPDYRIKLSNTGHHQARVVGSAIKGIVSKTERANQHWKVMFYVSPSNRAWETLEEIVGAGETFPKDQVIRIQEECRLREQHFGNFQEVERRRKIKGSRSQYGKFFYRVPDGESSGDVYDRVSTFLESLWRDMENASKDNNCNDNEELNVIVVSHGLTILLFLMKWFNWTVNQFEALANPKNCEYRVLQLGPKGDYSLAVHHTVEELKEWGLTEDMIKDQKARAFGHGEIFLKCDSGSMASDDSDNVDDGK